MTTIVSRPMGFRQHGAAVFVSVIDTASTCPALGFATVRKLPNVFGSSSDSVKTREPFRVPR